MAPDYLITPRLSLGEFVIVNNTLRLSLGVCVCDCNLKTSLTNRLPLTHTQCDSTKYIML